MDKQTVRDIQVGGKRVFVRCDFNVPMSGGKITDDNRIVGALPTIRYLLDNGAKVILASHLGRPKGVFDMKYSLAPVADRLNELLDGKVKFASDVIGEDAQSKVANLCEGEAVLLENLRFHKQEEANDRDFSAKLASFCDVYVNDAFGTAHRAHASTAGMVEYGFVKTAVAGFLMEKEIKFIGGTMEHAEHPFVAILGGAKVSDKIGVINNLIDKADCLIIGGAMAYTFIKAKGYDVGCSRCETDKLDYAREMIAKAEANGTKLLLPIDTVVAENFPDPIDKEIDVETVDIDKIPSDMMGLDIGDKTCRLFADEVVNAGTVIWNGPMGVFENPILSTGTKAVAQAMSKCSGITVIGGGDSAAAAQQLGYGDKITHISTGGGASLEFIEGKILPGVECLNDKE